MRKSHALLHVTGTALAGASSLCEHVGSWVCDCDSSFFADRSRVLALCQERVELLTSAIGQSTSTDQSHGLGTSTLPRYKAPPSCVQSEREREGMDIATRPYLVLLGKIGGFRSCRSVVRPGRGMRKSMLQVIGSRRSCRDSTAAPRRYETARAIRLYLFDKDCTMVRNSNYNL
ncbi:hypothetical protein Y032_0091g2489 [Ancylostoma ceylanicum]|nr:hypothetical protein Y032_0091g2489 [Ancylostoma ceylanicum]